MGDAAPPFSHITDWHHEPSSFRLLFIPAYLRGELPAMTYAFQTAAAAIIFNGYQIAPMVVPFPPSHRLVMSREVPAFKQLTAYMARYKELDTIEKWAPYEVFFDSHGLCGAALSPWLRGGARYLQSIMERDGLRLDAPEHVAATRWFSDIQNLLGAVDDETRDQLHAVRSRWDEGYSHTSLARAAELNVLYRNVEAAMRILGLESQPQRINAMRKENCLQV